MSRHSLVSASIGICSNPKFIESEWEEDLSKHDKDSKIILVYVKIKVIKKHLLIKQANRNVL